MLKKIKAFQFFILFTGIFITQASAQVKIAANQSTAIAAGAMLDIQSTDKGLLLPNISLTSSTMQLGGVTPAIGMLIFNTNNATVSGRGIYIYQENEWKLLLADTNIDLPGNYKISAASYLPGYLLCDGRAVSRTYYNDLYVVIGTSFGDGNGTSTFNLPDFRGRVFAAIGTGTTRSLGKEDGAPNSLSKLSETQMPRHRHLTSLAADNDDGSFGNTGSTKYNVIIGGKEIVSGRVALTEPKGGAAHSDLQPTIFGGNFFIKY